jgi:hypothetical protein
VTIISTVSTYAARGFLHMIPARRSTMAPLLTLLLIAAGSPMATAQDVHRCEENGRVVFSDKPCRDAKPVPAPARQPAPSSAPSSAPAASPAAAPAAAVRGAAVTPGLGYATREQSCAAGSKTACDELACIRNDMEACKRIGGLRGSFWFEESRRRETLRGTGADGKPTLRRVTLHKLRCTGSRKDRSAEVMLEGDGYRFDNGKTVYPSIDAAATALCRG